MKRNPFAIAVLARLQAHGIDLNGLGDKSDAAEATPPAPAPVVIQNRQCPRLTIAMNYPREQARAVVLELFDASRWFKAEPLPWDQWRIVAKPDAALPAPLAGVWFSVETEGGVNVCSLGELLAANEEGAPELCAWARCAQVAEQFIGGGGAAVAFTFERIS